MRLAVALALSLWPSVVGAYPATVLDCHDGDTCSLSITERSVFGPDLVWRESVRLCNINAPELSTGAPGAAARDALVSWVRAAKAIEFMPALKNERAKRDKYGRLLGWIFADQVNLNDKLLAQKLAVAYLECAP